MCAVSLKQQFPRPPAIRIGHGSHFPSFPVVLSELRLWTTLGLAPRSLMIITNPIPMGILNLLLSDRV